MRLISEKAPRLHVFSCFIGSGRTGSSRWFVFSLNIPSFQGEGDLEITFMLEMETKHNYSVSAVWSGGLWNCSQFKR